jgi:hemerythrin
MPYITWNDAYSIHHKEIDLQHQKLVALINELFDAMSLGRGKDTLAKTLGELIEYSRTHFSYEERLMAGSAYAGYLAHKAEHEAFTQKVLEFQGQFLSGQAALTVKVSAFLKDWLTNHILGTDQKYVPHLIAMGIL